MVEITSNLFNKWSLTIKDNVLTVNIHKEMTNLILDIVTGCVFGSVTTTLEDVEHKTFNIIGIIPIINRLSLPSKRRIDKSKRNVKYAVQYIIDERKKGLTKSVCKCSFPF